MNRFLNFYMEQRKLFPSWEDRKITFIAVTRAIAENGTMDDLKMVTKYYEHEREEVKNERKAIAN